jgi:hypothetical protein
MLRNGGWVCNGGWVFDLSVIFFFFFAGFVFLWWLCWDLLVPVRFGGNALKLY